MRTALKEAEGDRLRVRATVSRLGKRPTVLLVDGRNATTGDLLFDHLWMTTGKWARVPWRSTDWRALGPSDVIKFDVRVTPYVKGYFGRREIDKPIELDWKLIRPTRVDLVRDSLWLTGI